MSYFTCILNFLLMLHLKVINKHLDKAQLKKKWVWTEKRPTLRQEDYYLVTFSTYTIICFCRHTFQPIALLFKFANIVQLHLKMLCFGTFPFCYSTIFVWSNLDPPNNSYHFGKCYSHKGQTPSPLFFEFPHSAHIHWIGITNVWWALLLFPLLPPLPFSLND